MPNGGRIGLTPDGARHGGPVGNVMLDPTMRVPLWFRGPTPQPIVTATQVALSVTTADTSLAADGLTNITWRNFAMTDSSVLADQAVRAALLDARTSADVSLSTDAAGRLLLTARTAADSSLSADSAGRGAVLYARVLSDTSLSLSVATRITSGHFTTSETSLSSDAASGVHSVSPVATDTTLSTDQATRAALLEVRTTSDTSLSTDIAQQQAAFSRGGTNSYTAAVLADGPTAYWYLNETSGTVATDHADGDSGTYQGGFTLGAAGPTPAIPLAVQFNGLTSTQALLSTQLNLKPTNGRPWVVEAWVNCTSFANTPAIFSEAGSGWSTNIRTTGQASLQLTIGTIQVLNSNTILSTNTWYHLVLGWDGNGHTFIYVNGQLDAVGTVPIGNPSANSGPWAIGNASTGNNHPFAGRIAQVVMWQKVLTAAQVANHYALAQGGDASVIADSVGIQFLSGRTTADSSLSTDAAVLGVVLSSRAVSDTSNTTDQAARVLAAGQGINDVSITTDAVARTDHLLRAIADISISTDSASRLSVDGRASTDVSASADALVRSAQARNRITADASVTTDSATVGNAPNTRSAHDTSNTTDAATISPTARSRSATDISQSLDQAVRAATARNRITVDTSLSADAVSRAFRALRAAVDISASADGVVRAFRGSRATSETSTSFDNAVGARSGGQTTTDTSQTHDVVVLAPTVRSRASTDTSASSDQTRVGAQLHRVFDVSVSVDQPGIAARRYLRSSSDISITTDQAVDIKFRQLASTDISITIDQAAAHRLRQTSATDVSQISDLATLHGGVRPVTDVSLTNDRLSVQVAQHLHETSTIQDRVVTRTFRSRITLDRSLSADHTVAYRNALYEISLTIDSAVYGYIPRLAEPLDLVVLNVTTDLDVQMTITDVVALETSTDLDVAGSGLDLAVLNGNTDLDIL